MVSRTILDDRQISTLPSKEGVIVCIYSHPKKGRFFDTKPKCGSNCGQNLRPTRINTGVSADFRLQPQKPRFRTWVSGDLAEISGRRKRASSPVFMRVRGTLG